MFKRILLVALLAATMVPARTETVVIRDDLGGRLSTYRAKYVGWRDRGVRVVVDGICASACTLVTRYLPDDRICVTSRAALLFHNITREDGSRDALTSLEGLDIWNEYPAPIRNWLWSHSDRLMDTAVIMPFDVLKSIYAECSVDTGDSRQSR